MIALAHGLGWLDGEARRVEHVALTRAVLARRTLGFTDVDFACRLNADGHLDGEAQGLAQSLPGELPTAHAAVLACLGGQAAQAQVLRALASPRDADVQVAQAYLRHRPLEDSAQLREVAVDITRMPPSPAKVRALDALSKQYISDEAILEALARSFARAESAKVQQAIAGVLVRSDYRKPGLAAVLREHRLDKPGGGGLIDALIDRLPPS
jgi:uroporphyrinogen-III synthase